MSQGVDRTEQPMEDGSGTPARPAPLQGTTKAPESKADAALVVRFVVRGLLRFLSHAETFRLFERACARASLPVKHSQGFNPHPKLSLPLPRPVGVQSEDELLIVRLSGEHGLGTGGETQIGDLQSEMRDRLAAQLPEGIEVREVALMQAGTSIQAESVEYVFPLAAEAERQKGRHIRAGAERLLASETAVVERTVPDRRQSRRIEVRPFVKAIRFEPGSSDGRDGGAETQNSDIIVTCRVGNAGSIRVEELLQLLDLAIDDLAGPIRRRHVTWIRQGQGLCHEKCW